MIDKWWIQNSVKWVFKASFNYGKQGVNMEIRRQSRPDKAIYQI